MALARIISRSHACSRQLAMDLLSRGYAVEVVSPDAIPDNIADLELRVEEDPGNQLVATVEARNGERSASLDFLHYLKAPMPDFVRRPPELQELLPLVDSGNDPLNLEHSETADVFEITIPSIAPLPKTTADIECLITIPLKQPQIAVPVHLAAEKTIVAPNIETMSVEPVQVETKEVETFDAEATTAKRLSDLESPRPKPSRRLDRSSGWLWRAALTSCALIGLALLLVFGTRRNGQASGQSNVPAVLEQAASVPSDAAPVSLAPQAKDSTQVVAPASSPTPRSEAIATQAVKQIPVTKSVPAIEKPGARVARHREDDIIARDTVTYLDKRFQPRTSAAAAKKSQLAKRGAQRHKSPHHQGDVIAANKVTYLNKPTPKSAK